MQGKPVTQDGLKRTGRAGQLGSGLGLGAAPACGLPGGGVGAWQERPLIPSALKQPFPQCFGDIPVGSEVQMEHRVSSGMSSPGATAAAGPAAGAPQNTHPTRRSCVLCSGTNHPVPGGLAHDPEGPLMCVSRGVRPDQTWSGRALEEPWAGISTIGSISG